MAHVAVIGAGVIGVSSAYLLAREGHQVTLIDAGGEPGTGASAGNAAQLSWAYGDAMASPSLLRHLPAIVLGRDPAFRIRWHLDSDFLRWGLRFLANMPEVRWWANTRAILDLADRSRRELAALLAETDISFDYRVAGKLHLYPDAQSFAAARPLVERKSALGLEQRMLSRADAQVLEPALAAYQGEIEGTVFTPNDALGDAASFCRQLTRHMIEQYQVALLPGRRATGFEQRAGRLSAIRFEDREELVVDAAVVAAGPQARMLCRDLPEAQAIRPVRGYSLTVARNDAAPLISLTDVKRKLAFASVGNRFRVAGLADLDPSGAGFDPARFEVLQKTAANVLPSVFSEASECIRWSGERPMMPSSRPIIAPARRIRGVYLNAGHGMLGWTLALGSARHIVDMLSEAHPPG